jgi:phosphoribosylanthranilate isomerase
VAAIQVKICCIASVAEARAAIRRGADAIGLVSAMPSGPGPIPEALIAEIAGAVRGAAATILLTSLTEAAAIAAQVGRCGVTAVQLCDAVTPARHAVLRAALPGVTVVQVVHVTGADALERAQAAAAGVDALLLDSGNPAARVKELGGTGRTHDWTLSRRIVGAVSVPVWLAGGLTAANVADAIRAVGPTGVDVCTGVRTGGRLDERKLAAFVRAVRGA